jgi:predicted RecA/RadA family phage recombinase
MEIGTVTEGDLVMLNAAGFALLAAALAGNEGIIGIASQTKTGTVQGATKVLIHEGVFKLPANGLTQADKSKVAYLSNAASNQVETVRSGATFPVAGVIDEFISATFAWVEISQRLTRTLMVTVS